MAGLDIKKYEALLAAVDLGSFSAAAEALQYTPSGISNMVDSVEAALGFPLLRRGRFGVTLTEYGNEVIGEIRSLVKQEQSLLQHAADLSGLMTGMVTVGAYYSISSHWLPSIFRDFLQDFPGINVHLQEGGRQLLSRWMLEKELDFCLYSFDPEDTCDWIPLREDPMVVVVPMGHPFAQRESVTLEECRDQPFIMTAQGRDHDIISLLKQSDVDVNVRFSTLENYSALALVESGLGISIMNQLITRGLDRRVKYIPLSPPRSISLGIAVPSMETLSPAARKLIEYICASLAPKL